MNFIRLALFVIFAYVYSIMSVMGMHNPAMDLTQNHHGTKRKDAPVALETDKQIKKQKVAVNSHHAEQKTADDSGKIIDSGYGLGFAPTPLPVCYQTQD